MPTTILSERLFQKFRNELAPYLADVGLDERIFETPDLELPIDRYNQLMQLASRNGSFAIGHEMGKVLEASDVGALSYAIANASCVQQLLETLARYIYVFAQDNAILFGTVDDSLVVRYDFTGVGVSEIHQDVEFALTAIVQMIRNAANQCIKPKLVEFALPEPSYANELSRYFGCEIRYSANSNRVHFHKSVLDLTCPQADPRLFEALEFYLKAQLEDRDQHDELRARVQRAITSSLHRGIPTLPEMARKLGMSQRTLQRRLQEQDLNYSAVIDDVRRRIAVEYVTQTSYKIGAIAEMAGYEETSSFCRSFRRWTGASPDAVRRMRQSGSRPLSKASILR